jgi:DNA-binding MarR family transcriptional regulator
VEESAATGGPYIGTLLRICWQWVREELYNGLIASGYDGLSRAQVTVFRFPTPEGLRPSELAERLQITKQSVNDLLRDLEALGYLTREVTPDDGRARVVRLTAKGRRLERAVYRETQLAELRMAKILGSERFDEFRRLTVEAVEALTGQDVSSVS